MKSDAYISVNLFACQKCGDCCKGFGGAFVTKEEIHQICRYLNLDPGRFVSNYCQMSGGKPVLAQGKNGYCIFWEELCLIHSVKPRMCRVWPFIESILVDVKNWQVMAASCPGMRTDLPESLIKKYVREVILKTH